MHTSKKVAGLVAALAAAALLAPGCKKAPPAEDKAPPAAPHGEGAANPHGAGGPPATGAAPASPEAAKAVVLAYQVTLPRAEAYAKAVRELRTAAEKDAMLMARLRAPKPAGIQQAELAAWLEAIPEVKTILDRHRLKGLDLILMPQALMHGRNAYDAEKKGGLVVATDTNLSSLELHRADYPRMYMLVTAVMEDLKVISGS
jgi:hypothetical protein